MEFLMRAMESDLVYKAKHSPTDDSDVRNGEAHECLVSSELARSSLFEPDNLQGQLDRCLQNISVSIV
jgi:hypothetical protein